MLRLRLHGGENFLRAAVVDIFVNTPGNEGDSRHSRFVRPRSS
jgi:hypothetical protein